MGNNNFHYETNNGLVSGKCKSTVEAFIADFGEKNIGEFAKEKFGGEGVYIAYLFNKVIIGKFSEGKFINRENEDINIEYLIRLRIFDKDKELLIYRKAEKKDNNILFKFRLRKDSEGEETYYTEANQVLFGTDIDKGKSGKGFTTITEDRGTEITLPFDIAGIDTERNRIKIKTRHYIEFDGNDNAGYTDARFIEFTQGFENKPIGKEN